MGEGTGSWFDPWVKQTACAEFAGYPGKLEEPIAQNMSGLDLVGKNCIVTGATGGLGRCIAKHLWNRGANLVLAVHHSALAESMMTWSSVVPDQKLHSIWIDLGLHPLVLSAWPSAILARINWKNVHALINNAAVLGPVGPLEQNDWADWEQTIRVNLLAPVALCRAVVPFMKDTGGSIVNLSGGGATKARPNFTAYACAKTALVRFTETFAQEVAQYNIRVNAVAPGGLATAMNQQVIEAGEAAAGVEEYELAVLRKDEADRRNVSTLEEKAAAVVGFLASDASKPVTGKLISAEWDDWRSLPSRIGKLSVDMYTLRRVT